MNRYSICIISILLVFNISCKAYLTNNNCDKITNCINTDKFKAYFNLCDKDQNPIYIFDSTESFLECKPFKIICGKTVAVKKMDFIYDINKVYENRTDKGIILFEYQTDQLTYKLSFIDTLTNSVLKLTFNKKHELIEVHGGSF